jgi:hypothetical protein
MADYNPQQQDAVEKYLAGGGTQADVDAYFAGNPTQEQFQSDVSAYFTPNAPPSDIAPDHVIQPAPPIMTANGMPASWIDVFNRQSPEVQAAIQTRYGNMSSDAIMRDWEQTVMPSYKPGTSMNDMLSGMVNIPTGTVGIESYRPPGAQAAPGNAQTDKWQSIVSQQSPAVQQMIRDRYGNMSPEQIMQDWTTNIAPKFPPGTSVENILSGAVQPGGPPALTANAMTPGNARMSHDYQPTGMAGYRDPGASYRAAMADPNRVTQEQMRADLHRSGFIEPWEQQLPQNARYNEATGEYYMFQDPAEQQDQQQQDQQMQQLQDFFDNMFGGQSQSQAQAQYQNPNWYQQGFQPGGTNDPMIVQNAIDNQSDPNTAAGLFKNLMGNFNQLQQQQGGSRAIMSSLDAPVQASQFQQQVPPAPPAPAPPTPPVPKPPQNPLGPPPDEF